MKRWKQEKNNEKENGRSEMKKVERERGRRNCEGIGRHNVVRKRKKEL